MKKSSFVPLKTTQEYPMQKRPSQEAPPSPRYPPVLFSPPPIPQEKSPVYWKNTGTALHG